MKESYQRKDTNIYTCQHLIFAPSCPNVQSSHPVARVTNPFAYNLTTTANVAKTRNTVLTVMTGFLRDTGLTKLEYVPGGGCPAGLEEGSMPHVDCFWEGCWALGI